MIHVDRMHGARQMVGLAAVATLLGSAPVWAQMPGAATSAGLQRAEGKIAAIDPQRNALKLQAPAGGGLPGASPEAQATTFMVDEQTAISKGPQKLTLRDLKVGDAVKVEYASEGGKNVARSIAVQEAAGGASTPSGAGSKAPTGGAPSPGGATSPGQPPSQGPSSR
jgi:hypothetical protein